MKSILDRTFRYTPAAQTDLRKTFARARRELRLADEQPAQAEEEATTNVSPLRAPAELGRRHGSKL